MIKMAVRIRDFMQFALCAMSALLHPSALDLLAIEGPFYPHRYSAMHRLGHRKWVHRNGVIFQRE